LIQLLNQAVTGKVIFTEISFWGFAVDRVFAHQNSDVVFERSGQQFIRRFLLKKVTNPCTTSR